MGADEFDYQSPIIGISPEQISFISFVGGSNPQPQILSIYNLGFGTLNWEINKNCSWLQANPTTGVSNGDINEVIISVNTAGLGLGEHTCELTVTGNGANNSPRKIQVNLTIGNTINVPSDFNTIQAAIDASSNGMVVMVAPGTYTGQGNRDLNFAGKAITIQSTNPYDPAVVAATIIDCQGSGSAYHRGFYFHSGEGSGSIVSGLTIINGYIGGTNSRGGGIYCENSNPTIKYCVFRNNYAGEQGGGISLRYSNSTISHCIFTANNSGYFGGGLACESPGNAIIKHCVFVGNGQCTGGGIAVHYSSAQISHCILWGNTGYQGAGQLHLIDTMIITVAYSDIQGGQTGVSHQYGYTLIWGPGNINSNPNFVDMANYDYHLQSNSPCVNAGDPCYIPEPNETDIDGQPRVMACRVDIGVDEVELEEKKADFTKDCTIDLDDLYIFS